MRPEIEISKAFIQMDEEGILWLKVKDGVKIEKKDMVEMFEMYKKWGCNSNKVLQIIKGGGFFVLNNDAQHYASKVGKEYFIASALVGNSLAVGLAFNFFNSFFKHNVPFAMFPSEIKALNWLRKFKEK